MLFFAAEIMFIGLLLAGVLVIGLMFAHAIRDMLKEL